MASRSNRRKKGIAKERAGTMVGSQENMPRAAMARLGAKGNPVISSNDGFPHRFEADRHVGEGMEVVPQGRKRGASMVIMVGLPHALKEPMQGTGCASGGQRRVRPEHPRGKEREQIVHIMDGEVKADV